MPNYVNPLVVGTGPNAMSDIGAQQYRWAGFNNQVDEANLARIAQANAQAQAQSNWMTQAAQQEADRQAAAQQNAQRLALNNALTVGQMAESRRQFDVGAKLAQEKETTQKEQFDQTLAANKEAQKLAEQQANNKIDTEGQTIASNYLVAKNNAEAAQKALDAVQGQIDDLETENKTLAADKANSTQVLANNQRLKALQAELRIHAAANQAAQNRFQTLTTQAGNRGFEINDEDGVVVHGLTGKKWSFKAALKAAEGVATEALPFPGFTSAGGGAFEAIGSSPNPLTAGTGTADAQAPVKKWVLGPGGQIVPAR